MFEEPAEHPVSEEILASAEKLLGLRFTVSERAFMLEEVAKRLKHYDALRTIPLDNSVVPPLVFTPQPPSNQSAYAANRIYADLDPPRITERPANLEALAFSSISDLAYLLRSRQVTSVELTQMYLARLRRYDPVLKCVVSYCDDLAMEQARRADAEIAQGQYRSPLHGIPWGAKDLLATRRYPTTWGAEPFRDQIIDLDASVVQRLDEAGAVLVAKLSLGALAYGDIWFGGRTQNPWDITEGSSGSSAGSAAATAAGLVGFSIGTETLGSIVSPSTRCGVTGLRPTFGRISRYGAMTLSWSMDKIGPICRSVTDCALVFSAIYGADGLDLAAVNLPFAWNSASLPGNLRIGYVASAFAPNEQAQEDTQGQEQKQRINDLQVLETLRTLGIEMIPIELPDEDLEPYFLILVAEAAAMFDELTRRDLDDTLTWQEKQAWPNMFRSARFIPAVEYIHANRQRARLIQQMAALMEQVDVFVVPSFSGNVLALTNLTGHPAVVLPNGFTEKGTPTSITFVGNLYREDQVLTVAKAYQDATDFHLRHPPLNF